MEPRSAATDGYGRKGLKILAWPKESNRSNNPYQQELYRALPARHDVDEFGLRFAQLRRLLSRKYDIFHMHWLERAFWAPSAKHLPKRLFVLFVAAAILRLRGTRFIWTVHDAAPHDMSANHILKRWPVSWIWKLWRRVAIRSLSGVIYHSDVHRQLLAAQWPGLERLPSITSPHPHYGEAYPATVGREEARARLGVSGAGDVLAFVGNIRKYKGVDDLIRAAQPVTEGMELIVAGNVDGDDYRRELSTLIDASPHIHGVLTFIPDDRLQDFFAASDVVVLPFGKVTTSGSAMLALTFGKPIAVPNTPVFAELRSQLGEDHVYLFETPLTPDSIRRICEWGRAARAKPDLSDFSWRAAAARTEQLMLQSIEA